jgi:hypothetical protein
LPDLVAIGVSARLAAILWAIGSATFYVIWLHVFERWLEPWLRRCASALVGSSVEWVSTGLLFRTWGLRDPQSSRSDGAVGLAGGAFVVGAAFFPVIALAVASRFCSADPAIEVTTYLAATPLVAIFVLRLLLGGSAQNA